MTQLVKGFTKEEPWQKADDEDLKKAANQFRRAFEETQSILNEYEPEEME